MVYLYTLGRLEVRTADGRRVRGVHARPKDLALLAFVAGAGAGGFCRRDALLSLFWPDLDAAHGRNALSQAWHRLRGSLPVDVLLTEGRDELGLASDRFRCDAASFESYLDNGDLREALRLYQGDYLAGFHASGVAAEFDDWVAIERERLRRRAFNAALVLAEVEEQAGRVTAAIGWLRQALHLRPGDETICCRLVEALAATGDRTEAIAEYARFSRRLRDDFGLAPSGRTQALADAIRSQGASGPSRRKRDAPSPDVFEALLRGRYFTSTIEHTARGFECLQRAVHLDPDCAPAHAAIAMSVVNLAVLGHLPPAAARTQAGSAAARALDADPGLGEAHTAAGMTAMVFDWDWRAADQSLRTGITLSPYSSDTHAYHAQFLCAVGRVDDGVTAAETALQLDPLGIWANFALGWSLFRARRHRDSLARLAAVLELYPHFAYAHLFVAENHVALGERAEAVDACRRALGILADDQLLLGLTACVTGLCGDRHLASALQTRLEALVGSRHVCPGHRAAGFLGIGDRDRAFECWEAMCRERSALAVMVPHDPLYDTVRGDDRFAGIAGMLRMPRLDRARDEHTPRTRRSGLAS